MCLPLNASASFVLAGERHTRWMPHFVHRSGEEASYVEGCCAAQAVWCCPIVWSGTVWHKAMHLVQSGTVESANPNAHTHKSCCARLTQKPRLFEHLSLSLRKHWPLVFWPRSGVFLGAVKIDAVRPECSKYFAVAQIELTSTGQPSSHWWRTDTQMLFAWSIERYSNEYDSLYAGYEFEWFFIYQVGMIHEARNGQEGKGALWTIYQAVLSGEHTSELSQFVSHKEAAQRTKVG